MPTVGRIVMGRVEGKVALVAGAGGGKGGAGAEGLAGGGAAVACADLDGAAAGARQGRGGSVVNVASQRAEVARPGSAAYSASKGGGRSLTQAMALDLAAHRIRVNAIAPGPTLTGLTRASYADPERRRATIAQIPLGRLGDPKDLVGTILFLASDDSVWATGSTVTVDGGYNAM